MTAPSPGVRRTLRDIDDGHITLYATIERFDPQTGARNDAPKIVQVDSDRSVPSTVPDARGAWWVPMIDAGWLELDDRGRVPRLVATDAGRAIANGGGES